MRWCAATRFILVSTQINKDSVLTHITQRFKLKVINFRVPFMEQPPATGVDTECTHVHPIIFAKQSKLVGIIHAYTLEIRFRSDYE